MSRTLLLSSEYFPKVASYIPLEFNHRLAEVSKRVRKLAVAEIIKFKNAVQENDHEALRECCKIDDVAAIRYFTSIKNSDILKYAFEFDAKRIINHLMKQQTPKEFGEGLIAAAKAGNMQMVNHFLQKGAINYFEAINAAASNGHLEIIEHLYPKIKYSLRIKGRRDVRYNWNAALKAAAENGHMNVIEFVLDKRGQPNHGVHLETALEAACNIDIAELLIANGAKVNEQCMQEAIAHGNMEMYDYYVSEYSANHKITVSHYLTTLQSAVRSGKINIVEEVILRNNVADEMYDWRSALIRVCQNGNMEILSFILSRIQLDDEIYGAAICTAAANGQKYVLQRIIYLTGHPPIKSVIDAAITIATTNKHGEIARYLKEVEIAPIVANRAKKRDDYMEYIGEVAAGESKAMAIAEYRALRSAEGIFFDDMLHIYTLSDLCRLFEVSYALSEMIRPEIERRKEELKEKVTNRKLRDLVNANDIKALEYIISLDNANADRAMYMAITCGKIDILYKLGAMTVTYDLNKALANAAAAGNEEMIRFLVDCGANNWDLATAYAKRGNFTKTAELIWKLKAELCDSDEMYDDDAVVYRETSGDFNASRIKKILKTDHEEIKRPSEIKINEEIVEEEPIPVKKGRFVPEYRPEYRGDIRSRQPRERVKKTAKEDIETKKPIKDDITKVETKEPVKWDVIEETEIVEQEQIKEEKPDQFEKLHREYKADAAPTSIISIIKEYPTEKKEEVKSEKVEKKKKQRDDPLKTLNREYVEDKPENEKTKKSIMSIIKESVKQTVIKPVTKEAKDPVKEKVKEVSFDVNYLKDMIKEVVTETMQIKNEYDEQNIQEKIVKKEPVKEVPKKAPSNRMKEKVKMALEKPPNEKPPDVPIIKNVIDKNVSKTLNRAASRGDFEEAERCVNIGCNREEYNVALSYAARNGSMSIVKLLVKNGANDYNSALAYAAKKNNKEIVDFMISLGADWFDLAHKHAKDAGHIEMACYLEKMSQA